MNPFFSISAKFAKPIKKDLWTRFACSVAVFGLSVSAFAASSLESPSNASVAAGLRATFAAYQETRSDLVGGYFERLAKRNLDILVVEGCDRLRLVGEVKLASQLQNEWSHQISGLLQEKLNEKLNGLDVGTLELGDFDPVSAWLDQFYNTLYYKTKGMVKGIRVIHDVYLMNYALAVVLKPNGAWRTHTPYDRIEYRKHFIPFANTVTYWGTLKTCQFYMPQYKKFCGNGAGYIEKFMGKYLAPRISDQVFALITASHPSHGQINNPKLDDLDYQAFETEMKKEFESNDLLED